MAKRISQLDRALNYSLAEVERVKDPAKLPLPVRTVVLVHAAQGIIDNGGLQYFFESDFPDQPPYSIFVDAYREIGAEDEANTLAAAVGSFPFPKPQKHKRRRNEFLDRVHDDGDSPFWAYDAQLCGSDQVWRLLAKYVRRCAKSFPR